MILLLLSVCQTIDFSYTNLLDQILDFLHHFVVNFFLTFKRLEARKYKITYPMRLVKLLNSEMERLSIMN